MNHSDTAVTALLHSSIQLYFTVLITDLLLRSLSLCFVWNL